MLVIAWSHLRHADRLLAGRGDDLYRGLLRLRGSFGERLNRTARLRDLPTREGDRLRTLLRAHHSTVVARWISPRICRTCTVAFLAWSARLFTSVATTANPRPCSPARAASTADHTRQEWRIVAATIMAAWVACSASSSSLSPWIVLCLSFAAPVPPSVAPPAPPWHSHA